MDEKQLTFEEVNAHFEKLNLSEYQEGGTRHFTSASAMLNPAGVLPKICGIYKAVRPLLAWVATLPMPTKWKTALNIFISLMDQLCP
jgi:hypothetical protein